MPRGARQRRRTADGHGHVRVLKGYSTKGAQKGYSQQRRKCFGCLRHYSSDRWWAVLGSAVRTRSMAVRIGYSRGTRRELASTGYSLTGYSWGTHTPGSSRRRRRCARCVQRQEGYSRGTPRVLIGVLAGYSEGADRVTIEYSRGTHVERTRHCTPRHGRGTASGGRGRLCRTRRAVLGSARHTGVGLVLGTALDIGYSRGTHAGPRGLCIGRSRYVATSGRGRATQCRAVCGAPRRTVAVRSTSGRQGHSAVLTGTPWVLIRYLQSTHGVRTRLLRIPPRTRIPFGWSLHWAVHGSARQPSVGLVMGRQLSSTHRVLHGTSRVLTGYSRALTCAPLGGHRGAVGS